MVNIGSLVEGLVKASEKAAHISRIVRWAYMSQDDGQPSDDGQLSSSIATEEKIVRLDGGKDFKTFADVLCQAVIDFELRKAVRL